MCFQHTVMKFIFSINLFVILLINSGQSKEFNICKSVPYRNDSNCELPVVTTYEFSKAEKINLYESIVHLYDHFHWDTNSFGNVVGKACGSDMKKYLKALNESEAWALRGKYYALLN